MGLALSRLSESRFPGKSPSRHVTCRIWQKRAGLWEEAGRPLRPSQRPAPQSLHCSSQVTDSNLFLGQEGDGASAGTSRPHPITAALCGEPFQPVLGGRGPL